MKIGIMTFHWASNYGAILQCFALQKTLQIMGYDVQVIDYMPKRFELSLWRIIRFREFLHPKALICNIKKEKSLAIFRKKYLKCSNRYYSIKQLQAECNGFDVLISGSDQVMNSYFLTSGERGGSTAYFLDFGAITTKRLTYAVSFGTTQYPAHLLAKTIPLIKNFNALSVREYTGKGIMEAMGRNAIVVPDPTLLLSSHEYDKFIGLKRTGKKSILVYMLHNRFPFIQDRLPQEDIWLIKSESMEEWLQGIKNSKYVITNSFHGTVFAILFHIPFTVVLKTSENVGMNDRFYTLLGRLALQNRIMTESDYSIEIDEPNWIDVDKAISQIRKEGIDFLQHALMDTEKI